MSKEYYKSQIASSLGLCPIKGSNTPLVSRANGDQTTFGSSTGSKQPNTFTKTKLSPNLSAATFASQNSTSNREPFSPNIAGYNDLNYNLNQLKPGAGNENQGLLKPVFSRAPSISPILNNTGSSSHLWASPQIVSATTTTASAAVYLNAFSPESTLGQHSVMYPTGYVPTTQANAAAAAAAFGVQPGSQLGFHSQNVAAAAGNASAIGGVLYPNTFYPGQPSAISQQGVPLINTLQPLQIPGGAGTAHQYAQPTLGHASNVAGILQRASNIGNLAAAGQIPPQQQVVLPPAQFQQPQPQHATFPGMSTLHPSSGVFSQPLGINIQNQTLAPPSSVAYENDADWRFRRSKEMFDQAQRSHQQQRVQDPYLKSSTFSGLSHTTNPLSFGFNQTSGTLGSTPQSGIFHQQHHPTLGKTVSYLDPNLSNVSASSLNPGLGQTGRSAGVQNTNIAPNPETLPSLHSSRGPPPVSARQGWSKFRSKSFDHEDLLSSHHSLFGGSGNNGSSLLGSNHVPGIDPLGSSHGPSSDPLGSIGGSNGSGSGTYGIPVDLAYKLHATHQTNSDSLLGHSTAASVAHSLHDAHSSHASHELQRNKSVSFDIPSHVEPFIDFEEASKLAQMFPNCAECQKLEQDKLIYRQALRLRKNNSDKSLHEYMRSGLDPRSSYTNPIEDRRLKDLAQLISETFSERLLEEERDRDSLYTKTNYSRRAESDYGPSTLYTPVGQKIPASHRSLPASSKWTLGTASDLFDEHLQMSPLMEYNSILRSGKKRGGILRPSEYDALPPYKDSSQYLNLEGLSQRGRNLSRSFTSGRSGRDFSLVGGSSTLSGPGTLPGTASGGGGGGGIGGSTGPFSSSGRHSAYASDMDSYFYDRDRYGSVNLARFNDSRGTGGGGPGGHPAGHPDMGVGDRRRNLKDIRYSRDYEFIPRAEDMGYSGGVRGRSKGSLSPTFLDSSHGSDMAPRRHSPRQSRKSDLYPNPSMYPSRHPPTHRKGRSSSVREDTDLGYHRNLESNYMNSEFIDHQNPPPPPHHSAQSGRNRQNPRRYGGPSGHANPNSGSSTYYNTPSHYNFGDEREPYRRGSSSDSMERLSSPERGVGGHRRSARRFQGRGGEPPVGSGGNDYRNYDDKIPPRRSTGGGMKDDPRQPQRTHSFSSVPSDQHPGGSKPNKPNFGPPVDNYSMNGSDRQKLSEVPPNHSTESGYSSQSQHTAMSRDDPRNNGIGGGQHMGNPPQPTRMRPPPHSGDPSLGQQNPGGPIPRNEPDGISIQRAK